MEDERYISPEIEAQNKAIEAMRQKTDYLVDSFDKVNERLSSMGKFMADSNKSILTKIEDNGGKLVIPRYTIKPTQSELTGELASAMSKAKAEFGGIDRGAQANRGKFSSISDMIQVTNPILVKYEIDASFLLGMNEHGEYTLTLKVTHVSNQWFETTVLLNEEHAAVSVYHQKIAAAEKGLRRYMFRTMFNLAEED